MSYLVFDTETTGLPRNWKRPSTDTDNWPRIVQIAWAVADPNTGQFGPVTSHIIRPEGFAIPEAASRVHGITMERAAEEGVALDVALTDFLNVLEGASGLVAHNVSFDLPVVGAEFVRHSGQDPLAHLRTICTKDMSTDYCRLPGRYGWKWPTLEELHGMLFNDSFDGSHYAGVDVIACAKCFIELVRRGVIKLPSTMKAVSV